MPLLKQRSKSFGFCFSDFLWRGKESQRGALPLSATASKEVSWLEPAQHYLSSRAATAQRSFTGGASAQAWRFLFFSFRVSPKGCSEALVNRAFHKVCPLARVFRASRRGRSEPRVNRASPGTLPTSPLFIRAPEVPAWKFFIYAGFRGGWLEMPYRQGFPRGALKA